jgi:FAD/FMN-containing dehydrogenase
MLNTQRAGHAEVQALDARLEGAVVGPGDEGWDLARQAWNLAADQRPALVAFPESAADVAAVVEFAASRGLRIAPQGTGHNATPLADLENTVLLSTKRMKGVQIDPEARRARVQAGVVWGEVTAPASEHGLAPLAGSSAGVGVIGYCLGGGLSWLARRHGLASDSVLAIELVTADGALRRVDADHDADLFWALRGGGGSFGVVTAMEIALYPVPELYAGAMFWPWERASEVLHAWREWSAAAPDAATTSARILKVPPLPEIPEPLRGRAFVTIDGAVLASDDEAAEILAPLRALGPEIDTFATVPAAALSYIHNDPEEPMPALSAHRLLGELTAEAVDAFVAAAGPGSDSPLLMAELRHLGGALATSAPGHGALGRMDGAYLLFAVGVAASPEMVAALEPALPAFVDAMAPWDAGTRYLNFEERSVEPRRFFDDVTHRRLVRVRERVGGELFVSNHPV